MRHSGSDAINVVQWVFCVGSTETSRATQGAQEGGVTCLPDRFNIGVVEGGDQFLPSVQMLCNERIYAVEILKRCSLPGAAIVKRSMLREHVMFGTFAHERTMRCMGK